MTQLSRRTRAVASVLLAGLLVATAACGSSDEEASGAEKVRFALDWTPNTNHLGVYVADELGYYEDAGIDLEIIPFASTGAPDLVAAGQADFGIAGQPEVQVARSAGKDLVTVYNILQRESGRLVALGDNADVTSPKDFDGTVYGGFNVPLYTSLARETVRGDGGKGDFTEVSLSTGAYEALSAGKVDFTMSVATWQDVEAEIAGNPYKAFNLTDFGVPDEQTTGIASSDEYLKAHPDTAKAFVAATKKGYQYAIDNPKKAAQLLIKANPDVLSQSEELVERSTQLMVDEGYFKKDGVDLGAAVPQVWDDFGQFMIDNGLVTDASGKVLTEAPDWSTYYTNDYLG
jgi:ABC-type nitrate/sulfonate/bicarbonate transport system substrate-binding protein